MSVRRPVLLALALVLAACSKPFAEAPSVRALLADGDRVYWLAGTQNSVLFSLDAKGKGDVQTLASGTGEALPLLASDGANFYWVAGGQIVSVPKTGGAPKAVVADKDITLVAAGPHEIYWVTGAPSDGGQQLKKLPKAGGDVVVLASYERYVRALAADATGVYWTSSDEKGGTGGQVRFMSPVSGEPKSLVPGLGRLTALRVLGDKVYAASGDTLVRGSTTGGNPEVLAKVPGLGIQGLAIAGETLYVLAQARAADAETAVTAQSALYKLPLAGGPAVEIAAELDEASAVEATTAGVFWLQPDEVQSIAAE